MDNARVGSVQIPTGIRVAIVVSNKLYAMTIATYGTSCIMAAIQPIQ